MDLEIFAKSDVGNSRALNEDAFGVSEKKGLIVVCDGMGGHNAGAHASRLAVRTVFEMCQRLGEEEIEQITSDVKGLEDYGCARLIAAVRLANQRIFQKSLERPEFRGMGTTLTAIEIRKNLALIVHIGDSRLYRFRHQKLERLTEDHTWVNELILDHEIDPREAEKFEKRNVITRAVGSESNIKIDLRIEPIESGDLFLLCTDGLTKALTDNDIQRVVSFNKKNLKHTVNHLIDNANMKDGSDNITVALMYIKSLEQADIHFHPISLTIKAEEHQITNLENKILKKTRVKHRLSGQIIDFFKRLLKIG